MGTVSRFPRFRPQVSPSPGFPWAKGWHCRRPLFPRPVPVPVEDHPGEFANGRNGRVILLGEFFPERQIERLKVFLMGVREMPHQGAPALGVLQGLEFRDGAPTEVGVLEREEPAKLFGGVQAIGPSDHRRDGFSGDEGLADGVGVEMVSPPQFAQGAAETAVRSGRPVQRCVGLVEAADQIFER